MYIVMVCVYLLQLALLLLLVHVIPHLSLLIVKLQEAYVSVNTTMQHQYVIVKFSAVLQNNYILGDVIFMWIYTLGFYYTV